jgi:hypothetical protein
MMSLRAYVVFSRYHNHVALFLSTLLSSISRYVLIFTMGIDYEQNLE